MRLREMTNFVWPGAAEKEPGFRNEIERLSRRTLWALGAIEIAMTVVVILSKTFGLAYPHEGPLRPWTVIACFAQGAALLYLARTAWGRRWGRSLSFTSGFLTTLLLTYFQILAASGIQSLQRNSGTDLMTVLLVGVALIPALPWQMFTFGFTIIAAQSLLIQWALNQGMVPGGGDLSESRYFTFVVLTLLSTALSATNYQRIFATWRAHQAALKANEESHTAETRAIVAEGVASMGRLAAAISHEFNTPLGSIKGSVSGILTALERSRGADPERAQRINQIIDKLGASAVDAVNRLEVIVRRMQRFANLDRADVQDVNLNEMLEDVVAVVRGELRKNVPIELDLRPVPLVRCQPQPLNSVFAGLLHRALERAPAGETVNVATNDGTGRVEVRVREPRGLTQNETVHLFDPVFRERAGRVAASNWTLFHARRILTEIGGEISVDSDRHSVVYRVALPSVQGSETRISA